jgi:hypothetical protein
VLVFCRVGEFFIAQRSRRKAYFGLWILDGTGEQEKSRPDDQEQEHVDSAGQIEHRDSEKRSRRRDLFVIE